MLNLGLARTAAETTRKNLLEQMPDEARHILGNVPLCSNENELSRIEAENHLAAVHNLLCKSEQFQMMEQIRALVKTCQSLLAENEQLRARVDSAVTQMLKMQAGTSINFAHRTNPNTAVNVGF